ncbi:gastrula zinc finger protein XlCGF52.1-like [Xyrichtys novacula]|uniref:Gastrula zinc finger protein XlCGF52.1-like n=1 Tax=Xyrichtys novacula TaxID=13765 RepID=A0AAV1HBZ5_XYRNO|nr:gastrula zinc finger protein XlCGF52.1-like [Xyrichtys novacula]
MSKLFAAASFQWTFRRLHVPEVASKSISTEMLKIEQVVVGSEGKTIPKEIKKEIVVGPVQSYHHESLQCFQCFITFCNSKAKERHMRKSHRELYKMQLQETDTIFTCYQCDKSFSSSELLSEHQATHSTEEKPFRCGYCQKNFLTYAEVNKHRRADCIERRFPCEQCGALFPSPARVRHHRITVHPQSSMACGTNTYKCCKCRRSFQTEEELLKHQEKYAENVKCGLIPLVKKRGRKPKNAAHEEIIECKKIKVEEDSEEGYGDFAPEECPSTLQTELKIPCPEDYCDLVFSSVTALRAHKRREHGPPPGEPHTCTECDESYAQLEQLQAHMSKAHCSEYTCPTCQEGFLTEGDLKIHQDTHTGGEEVAEKR